MPYSSEHKQETRRKIVESARVLFNRYGFEGVTIDMVMASAQLTRGGFYNHFRNKGELYGEAVSSFLLGRGAQWRDEAGIDISSLCPDMVRQMMQSYLSKAHLEDVDGQCPMIALPSDVARAKESVKDSYQKLLEAMVWLFENGLEDKDDDAREKALSLSALCIGGMVIARTLPDSELANEVRNAAQKAADNLIS